MIVAISAVSESGDHYLWCETGTVAEIIATMQSTEDFAYLSQVDVTPLQASEQDSAESLRREIVMAVDNDRYGE